MKITLRSQLTEGSRVHRPGATIDLPEKHARRLIDFGAAYEPGAESRDNPRGVERATADRPIGPARAKPKAKAKRPGNAALLAKLAKAERA